MGSLPSPYHSKNHEPFPRLNAKAKPDVARRHFAVFCSDVVHLPGKISPIDRRLLVILQDRPDSLFMCMEIESQLNEFLQEVRIGSLGELGGEQLSMVDELQRKTIREERTLSTRMACLQDDLGCTVTAYLGNDGGSGLHNHDNGGSGPAQWQRLILPKNIKLG